MLQIPQTLSDLKRVWSPLRRVEDGNLNKELEDRELDFSIFQEFDSFSKNFPTVS